MKTIENCYNGLKDSGYILINIRNVKTYPALENDFTRSMCDKFPLLIPQTNLTYKLSSINKVGHKTEPIFVFQKTLL